MQNAQSIAPSFPPVTSPQIYAHERQPSLPVGPTGLVHKGGVPWHKRLALTKAPSPAAHHVLLILGSFVSSSAEEAWPSKATLASMSGRSPRVVQRCLSELKAAGLISVRLSNGGSSHYRLTTATLDARVPPPLDARVSPPQTPASPEVRTSEGTKEKKAAAAISDTNSGQAETKRSGAGTYEDRHTCPKCGNDWPASYGTKCHTCRGPSTGRLQREYGDRYEANHEGGAAPVPGKYDGLWEGDEPGGSPGHPPGLEPKPDPTPLTPEVREELEALAVERDGYRKGPDGWVKSWM